MTLGLNKPFGIDSLTCFDKLGQVVRDGPQIVLGRHPADPVEASKRDRPRVTAQRPLAIPVVVVVEVRHDELAQRPVDRRAEAQARELR